MLLLLSARPSCPSCPALIPARLPRPPPLQAEGIGEETGPELLFSLAKVKGKGAGGLDDAAAPDFEQAPSSSSEGSDGGSGSESDFDSEDEQRRWARWRGGWVGRWASGQALLQHLPPSCCWLPLTAGSPAACAAPGAACAAIPLR